MAKVEFGDYARPLDEKEAKFAVGYRKKLAREEVLLPVDASNPNSRGELSSERVCVSNLDGLPSLLKKDGIELTIPSESTMLYQIAYLSQVEAFNELVCVPNLGVLISLLREDGTALMLANEISNTYVCMEVTPADQSRFTSATNS